MKKQYWYIILTYILVQVSAFPYVFIMKWLGYIQTPMTQTELSKLSGTWTIISFCVGLIIILLILRTVPKASLRNEAPASVGAAISWIIGGFFLSLLTQSIAGMIEQYAFGIGRESENTQNILTIMDAFPFLVVIIALIGPILEEIIFRKIVFGVIYERSNFFIAALVSSVFFAAAHSDFDHFFLYTAMGFTFAFLYAKTKRIIVPIGAHMLMNSLVILVQIEPVRKMIEEQSQTMQMIIGGFFS
ncbi:CPBP family intramembrane glutamic endopeptidase [Bacillus pumilus]|uniref:CPBP family intramembrane glutamic endopeptidase n=1 Tax=Bacillus pumilus TaxID=1408 RepID=UPI000D034F09|nr:CPBP family intramembrane glutamic endopeptidase [Bacillus pumilus]MCY7501439.1 CPBP family intramembrane metalloprotease [Bacillus pumilus]MCY7527522.1 CPBP family intramembrane metalloprotease [Bacillus pumilus]MED4440739.1 CPBP family intramembrane metalloprotease [Bacillus pumilus]MED4489301.1 CPBP family intramembrane metalloprotease [Bacillus pumilus]PRS32168.1 CPBP family intramembrane metalloprotease [Bacillus pumilus]